MEGKILGIPLAVIILALMIALLVNVPLGYIQLVNRAEIEKLRISVNEMNARKVAPPVVVVPTALPATPTPTEEIKPVRRVTFTPTPTP